MKKYCFSCNKRITIFTNRCKLKNGWICIDCLKTKYYVKPPYTGSQLVAIGEFTIKEFEKKYEENKLPTRENYKSMGSLFKECWEDGYSETLHDSKNNIKCPYCESTNTTRITMLDNALSLNPISKVGKQMRCLNCKCNF